MWLWQWLSDWTLHINTLLTLWALIVAAYVMRALIWTISHDVRWLRQKRIRVMAEPRPPKSPKSEGERRGDSLAMRIGAAALLLLAVAVIGGLVFYVLAN